MPFPKTPLAQNQELLFLAALITGLDNALALPLIAQMTRATGRAVVVIRHQRGPAMTKAQEGLTKKA